MHVIAEKDATGKSTGLGLCPKAHSERDTLVYKPKRRSTRRERHLSRLRRGRDKKNQVVNRFISVLFSRWLLETERHGNEDDNAPPPSRQKMKKRTEEKDKVRRTKKKKKELIFVSSSLVQEERNTASKVLPRDEEIGKTTTYTEMRCTYTEMRCTYTSTTTQRT